MIMKKDYIEVEIRAIIGNICSFQKKLVSQGGKYQGELYLCDIYFCKKEYTQLKEAEMNKVGSYGLRLRKSKSHNGQWENTLNVKTITKENDHNAWEEHEIIVDNFMETSKILLLTGFKPFFKLEKMRHHYALKDFAVFIEKIENFGCCVEVEIMTTPGNEKDAKNKILALLNKLGIEKSKIAPKSITNLIMQERAFKETIEI